MRLTRAFTGRSLAVWLPLAVTAIAFSVSGTPQRGPKRKIACKTSENAASCYLAHGRLAAYNGTPTMRLWKIGTNRIVAIHSGPGFKREGAQADEDNADPEMPENVERAMKPFKNVVFADFEICPLEPEYRGRMQDVCIESAKNIVVGEYSF
jgi:hypothetical protein